MYYKNDVKTANIGYLPELFLCGDDTLLRSPSLLEEFGYTGNTCTCDEVTAGK